MEDHVCPWRHAYLFDNPLRRLIHNPRKLFSPYLAPGDTALDMGCGMGVFSIGMARLVGEQGRVISVDLQQEMLEVLMKRAARAGVADRIRPHRCAADEIGITDQVDFIVAFWMVHEAPDQGRLLRQLRALLRDGGHFLIAEPKMHVSEEDFAATLAQAAATGWSYVADPGVRWSRSAVLRPAAGSGPG